MNKQDFKKKVLDWLKDKVDIKDKKVRVYNTRRYGLEVRIYNRPMEFPNTRKSFRERKEERDEQRHGSYGIHSRMISTYTHINEEDFENEDEKKFILEVLKTS